MVILTKEQMYVKMLVDAITSIKSNYGVKRNWDGDPCVPISYMWEGLNCSNDDFDLPSVSPCLFFFF